MATGTQCLIDCLICEVRQIPVIKEYGASADGRIWSYRTGKFIATRESRNGYIRVNTSVDGKHKTSLVHRLVASAWLDNPSNLPEVNHLDGIKANCSKDNLEWCTTSHNHLHAFSAGLNPSGEKHPRAKLTVEQVKDIRSSVGEWSSLMKKYGVGSWVIYAIRHRINWKHVQ
jgi:hypothetical protein